MGLLRVSVYANTVRKHSAQVVHGESVADEGLLHEEAIGLLMILGRIVIPKQKDRACLYRSLHITAGGASSPASGVSAGSASGSGLASSPA